MLMLIFIQFRRLQSTSVEPHCFRPVSMHIIEDLGTVSQLTSQLGRKREQRRGLKSHFVFTEHVLKNPKTKGWRDDLALKSTYCSSGGPSWVPSIHVRLFTTA